jgi:hypothetical protein
MTSDDDRRLCTDCAGFKLGNCLGKGGVWATREGARGCYIPHEVRVLPIRCAGFVQKKKEVACADQNHV